VISAAVGAILTLCSLGLLGAGGTAAWAETAWRHGDYVDLGSASYRTGSYALASDTIELHAAAPGWDAASALLGTVRIRAASAGGTTPIFLGIAPSASASQYLSGVAYATVRGVTGQHGLYTTHGGTAPALPPAQARIWSAHATGAGTQTLAWPVKSGSWTIVAMNADGSRPVSMRVNVAATLPSLPWLTAVLLTGGLIALALGLGLIVVPARRAGQPTTTPQHEQGVR
jgi:hypothetical protein